ncbi:uncharacterized protein LOC141884347 [Acropora palmata]|uniref:uncharacterized protein LOC141884347 n=1 Tax=Acropora palmata TaxID=6131 RepID=UPI003D9FD6C5
MAAARRRDLRDILTVMLYDDESSSDSSDEEDLDVLFVVTAFGERRILNKKLNIADLSEVQCEEMFRFQKDDMIRLIRALEIPRFYTGYQGSVCTGMEALMILLRRLAYPNRWCDLVDIFGRAEPELSIIFNMIVDDIYTRFYHLLNNLDLVWLDPAHFAQVIHQKGAPLDQCWGFIDGTAQQIAIIIIINHQFNLNSHKH